MTWVRTGVDVEICHTTILTEDIQSELPGTIGAVRRVGRPEASG